MSQYNNTDSNMIIQELNTVRSWFPKNNNVAASHIDVMLNKYVSHGEFSERQLAWLCNQADYHKRIIPSGLSKLCAEYGLAPKHVGPRLDVKKITRNMRVSTKSYGEYADMDDVYDALNESRDDNTKAILIRGLQRIIDELRNS